MRLTTYVHTNVVAVVDRPVAVWMFVNPLAHHLPAKPPVAYVEPEDPTYVVPQGSSDG